MYASPRRRSLFIYMFTFSVHINVFSRMYHRRRPRLTHTNTHSNSAHWHGEHACGWDDTMMYVFRTLALRFVFRCLYFSAFSFFRAACARRVIVCLSFFLSRLCAFFIRLIFLVCRHHRGIDSDDAAVSVCVCVCCLRSAASVCWWKDFFRLFIPIFSRVERNQKKHTHTHKHARRSYDVKSEYIFLFIMGYIFFFFGGHTSTSSNFAFIFK